MSQSQSSKKALGRGLSALIPKSSAAAEVAAAAVAAASSSSAPRDYFVCALDQIQPCSTQPRKRFDPEALQDLASSIRESGLIQPLVVRRLSGDLPEDAPHYELIAGERRWRASRIAGLTEVPVVVKDVSDAIAFALALIENIQRQDLNPIEEATAYQRLIEEFGFKHAELAEQVGKSRATISNAIRLLQLPQAVLDLLAGGELTAGHARALLTLEAADAEALAEVIMGQQLTVRETEAQVKLMREGITSYPSDSTDDAPADSPSPDSPSPDSPSQASPKPAPHEPAPIAQEIAASSPSSPEDPLRDDDTTRVLAQRLSTSLNAKVQVRDRHGKGRVEIQYESYDALQKLLDALHIDDVEL